MNSRTLAVQSFEQALTELERFNVLDDRANAATVGMLQAAADLAERRPEQFFGLEPSARERFLASRLIDLVEAASRSDELSTGSVSASDPSDAAPSDASDDITGSAALAVGPLVRAAGRFLVPILIELGIGLVSGGGGSKDASQPGGGERVDRELDDGFGFLAEQKQYIMGLTEQATGKLGRSVGTTGDGQGPG